MRSNQAYTGLFLLYKGYKFTPFPVRLTLCLPPTKRDRSPATTQSALEQRMVRKSLLMLRSFIQLIQRRLYNFILIGRTATRIKWYAPQRVMPSATLSLNTE